MFTVIESAFLNSTTPSSLPWEEYLWEPPGMRPLPRRRNHLPASRQSRLGPGQHLGPRASTVDSTTVINTLTEMGENITHGDGTNITHGDGTNITHGDEYNTW